MSDRFCPRCNAEVEDAGGYCLLGHPLRSVAPVASLADLRAEVDKAFEDARVQVMASLGEAPLPPPLSPGGREVITSEAESASAADPIVEFAPAPRMDWGPEKQGLLRRLG